MFFSPHVGIKFVIVHKRVVRHLGVTTVAARVEQPVIGVVRVRIKHVIAVSR